MVIRHNSENEKFRLELSAQTLDREGHKLVSEHAHIQELVKEELKSCGERITLMLSVLHKRLSNDYRETK